MIGRAAGLIGGAGLTDGKAQIGEERGSWHSFCHPGDRTTNRRRGNFGFPRRWNANQDLPV